VLFNSFEFIFAFLPVTVLAYFVLGRVSRTWALRAVTLASLFFYAWWRPINVVIIAPSIVFNFVLARLLLSLDRQKQAVLARTVLIAGIVFNVAFLGYFKYANFAVDAVNDAAATQFVLEQIILPLGISFITFQKIAFLVDVHARRVQAFTLEQYCLFVLFFPQLIAGPIVHYRELMPQFQGNGSAEPGHDLSVGLTLFVFGLAKKVLLADSIAPAVSSIFAHASQGTPVPLAPAWIAAAGFTLQIYFDFSGYSDMAIGTARMFGIRLPPNFDSPLRASSIIDFWSRWHMTLTRFLTGYVYNPMLLSLTRRRVATRGARANKGAGAFVMLVTFPTLVTMLVSGIWHGAGYTFILWGLLHGAYLVVNHGWRRLVPMFWPDKPSYARVMQPVGFVLTLLSVVVSMAVFRSNSVHGAGVLLGGMFGLSGIALPSWVYDSAGVAQDLGAGLSLNTLLLWVAGLAFVAFACPNSHELLNRAEPALGWQASRRQHHWMGAIEWRRSLAWLVVVSLIAAAGVVNLGGQSEFLYWQF
jgi:D-alanyl-lipoteichoic acid acyltransferase DltB (MBOAT superfamily)